jgi:hypothetical protein
MVYLIGNIKYCPHDNGSRYFGNTNFRVHPYHPGDEAVIIISILYNVLNVICCKHLSLVVTREIRPKDYETTIIIFLAFELKVENSKILIFKTESFSFFFY